MNAKKRKSWSKLGWWNINKYSIIYPPKGKAERTQWGPLDSLSILYLIEKPKLNFQKHERGSAFFETSKTFIVRMGGWLGGDQNNPSISSFLSMMSTSKMRWFQIWPQKLSTTITSKVKSNLSLKTWNFKTNLRAGNQLKITMVKKDLSSRCKLRFSFFFFKKIRF